MNYEQIIKLAVNREVKIVVTGRRNTNRNTISLSLDFFVKDRHDENFSPLIGTNHPKYYKFKAYSAEKSQYLQLEYSGVSRSQLNKILDAFKAQFAVGTNFEYSADIDKRIKYLKGLRVTARSVRQLGIT
ncbi:hypothetical protein MUK70_04835 [Dyadobacter chenwenxiniae]|uniref:Uncharacterized protein n=1 Tax=Dyadobacter chenwenxiniae TaxID=2906456 RepID=A0A9X1PNH4_9BACT|nr:hypothetical protein [Dyadobacter chenwenxiniae]MCF0049165.1 hypothetical protein [Dyadobacter chenwenxiniae]MCF0064627.1 hypothetical protein [Dyadobacter chenwenxiniae]UON84317.1 hypothetical protein MUK70_04835 [Dyadobacter chenwenxiniae]